MVSVTRIVYVDVELHVPVRYRYQQEYTLVHRNSLKACVNVLGLLRIERRFERKIKTWRNASEQWWPWTGRPGPR